MASLTDVAIIQGTHKLMQFLSGFACTTLLNIYFVSKLSGYWQVCVCVCIESVIITKIKYLWRLSEIETRQLNGWLFQLASQILKVGIFAFSKYIWLKANFYCFFY